jgi:hypothetical protein
MRKIESAFLQKKKKINKNQKNGKSIYDTKFGSYASLIEKNLKKKKKPCSVSEFQNDFISHLQQYPQFRSDLQPGCFQNTP